MRALSTMTPARLATALASETSASVNGRPGRSPKAMTPSRRPRACSGNTARASTPTSTIAARSPGVSNSGASMSAARAPRMCGRPAASASPSSPTAPRSRGSRRTSRVEGVHLGGVDVRNSHQRARAARRGHEAHDAPVGEPGHDHLGQLGQGRVDVQAGGKGAADLIQERELGLVALGGVGKASTVEGERALGRDVLEQVAVRVVRGDAARIVEADRHRPERPAERVLEREDDEGGVEVQSQAVEVGVALPALGGGRHRHRLARADHLGRGQRRRQRDAAEPFGERIGGQAGGPGHHQLVARLGQDVHRRRVPPQQLDAVVEHGAYDLGRPAGAVEALDQASEPGARGGRGRRVGSIRPAARVGGHRWSRPRRRALHLG